MKKKTKRIRAFLRENRQIYLFALFLTVWLGYFLSSWQERERRMMHCALDDAIPFVPAFIIPYLMWYAYVPLMLAAVCFLDKKYFPRQCAAFFGGAWACIAVLIAFPTAVDFRPDAAGDGVFLWLCRFIFAADRPVNVFPSLHCYEALCVHLTAFSCPRLKKMTALRVASAAMTLFICLSTVFIKQHSALDLAAGCAAALIAALPVMVLNRRRPKNDNKTVYYKTV